MKSEIKNEIKFDVSVILSVPIQQFFLAYRDVSKHDIEQEEKQLEAKSLTGDLSGVVISIGTKTEVTRSGTKSGKKS